MKIFSEILLSVSEQSTNAWLYLPRDKPWTSESDACVLVSDEVPPELEDEPDAGVPKYAKENNLKQVLPITILQDIVCNARSQKADADIRELFAAFEFYYNRDAFINFSNWA